MTRRVDALVFCLLAWRSKRDTTGRRVGTVLFCFLDGWGERTDDDAIYGRSAGADAVYRDECGADDETGRLRC